MKTGLEECVIVDSEAIIWSILLNFLVIIVAVALKSKLKGARA